MPESEGKNIAYVTQHQNSVCEGAERAENLIRLMVIQYMQENLIEVQVANMAAMQ